MLLDGLQIDYFPSKFDPARQAEKYPILTKVYTGKREKVSIYAKVNVTLITVFIP